MHRLCLRALHEPRSVACVTQAGQYLRHASTASASIARKRVGVAFDIDGVLLRGYTPLPHARDSLAALKQAGVPFVFLTNGGGELERVKAATLSKVLDWPVHEDQVILSHTPLRSVLGTQYADKKVLVMGCRDVMTVARSYGVTRAVSVPMLTHDDPMRYPFVKYDHKPLPSPEREAPFACVAILHDPNDWGAEIQVAIDVIRGGWPLGSGGNAQTMPVFASNFDTVFAGVYPVPRLAAGSFLVALKAVWQRVTGTELRITQCGKPSAMTFAYAREALHAWAQRAPETRVDDGRGNNWDALFMVGDNPEADIQGANAAGAPWRSVLVRTGVFTGRDNDARFPARHVVPGVRDAVQLALDCAKS